MEVQCDLCTVRSWRWEDKDSLLRHANNRDVAVNMRDRFPHPYTSDDADFWIRHVQESRPETDFAIVVDHKAVGGIGFVLGTDVERYSAEIGYWLGEEVWGRGIATAALTAVTRFVFEEHQLNRVFALPFEGNTGSRRVLEKAGYLKEGLLRDAAVKDGSVLNQVLYAITRRELGLPGTSTD